MEENITKGKKKKREREIRNIWDHVLFLCPQCAWLQHVTKLHYKLIKKSKHPGPLCKLSDST